MLGVYTPLVLTIFLSQWYQYCWHGKIHCELYTSGYVDLNTSNTGANNLAWPAPPLEEKGPGALTVHKLFFSPGILRNMFIYEIWYATTGITTQMLGIALWRLLACHLKFTKYGQK